MSFILLNDPASHRQRLIRGDHVCAVEVNKADQSVTLFLIGGQEVHLTHEESKQFVQHTKGTMHPRHTLTLLRGGEQAKAARPARACISQPAGHPLTR